MASPPSEGEGAGQPPKRVTIEADSPRGRSPRRARSEGRDEKAYGVLSGSKGGARSSSDRRRPHPVPAALARFQDLKAPGSFFQRGERFGMRATVLFGDVVSEPGLSRGLYPGLPGMQQMGR